MLSTKKKNNFALRCMNFGETFKLIKHPYIKKEVDLVDIVSGMRVELKVDNQYVINLISSQTSLLAKCILARKYLSPQSTAIEKIIKSDLGMTDPGDEISGDGQKRGMTFEIKFSAHARRSRFNFVQIRPDHNINFYIFVCYNLYDSSPMGSAYIIKIPASNVYDLIVKYGSYAHGTCKKLGKITKENLKGRNCEYALRCDPNSKNTTKSNQIWVELLKFEVGYTEQNF